MNNFNSYRKTDFYIPHLKRGEGEKINCHQKINLFILRLSDWG